MDSINWAVVIQLAALIAGAIGVYAAIRSDLALIHERYGVLKEDVTEIKADLKAHVNNALFHRPHSDV